MKKIISNRKLIDYLILILVASVIAIPMINKNLDIYADEGIQHVSRAYGEYLSFKEGNLFQNVIASFANNFGYSWNLFYGPLSTYGIIILKLVFGSFTISYKIFTYICLILSGIFMHKFVYKLTKNNNIAVLAGAIYLTFPYHITDLYIRNALGEYVSFIFIPMVFLGLYNLFNTVENHYYLSFGAIGLILTHNISTLITAFFATIYIIINIKRLKETYVIKGLAINVVFIVSVTSFFWVPMLEAKGISNYQVYEKNVISTIEDTSNHALTIKSVFATGRDETYVYELGLHVIIMLVFSLMTANKLKENRKEYFFCLISGFFCLWMSTKYFPWKYMPECMSIIQFPWRMLQIAGFFFSFVCSINMATVIKKYNYKDAITIIIICLIYLISLKSYVPYVEKIDKIENWKLGFMSGKEEETIAGTAKAEYLPVNAYNNRFYIATREDNIYVLDGRAIITDEEKNGTKMKAKIKTIDDDTTFELPYIYYPGYEVRTDGIIIDTFETLNGFIGIIINSDDEVELEVTYTGSKLMKLSVVTSLVGIVIYVIYFIKKH